MELALTEHFSKQDPSIRFQISPLVQQNSQIQSAFVSCLSELKLVSYLSLKLLQLYPGQM